MKLLLVRHGECQANVDGIVAGSRNDSPLTAKGEQEAKAVGEQLAGSQIDAIVATPLQRSRRTAEIIRDLVAPNLQVEIDPDFSELDVGDATGLPLDQYFAKEKADKPIPHAETPEKILSRVQRGLNKLRQTSGTTLLVSHNGTCRMIECALHGWPADQFADLPGLQNGEVKEFTLWPTPPSATHQIQSAS